MKSKFNRTNQTIGMLMAAFLALAVWQPKAQAAVAASGGYVQVNLVSDISSNAPHTDHQGGDQ